MCCVARVEPERDEKNYSISKHGENAPFSGIPIGQLTCKMFLKRRSFESDVPLICNSKQ